MLFGPAYKGISLVSSTAIALSSQNLKDINFAFNRKEVKDHGEGGQIIGYPISGNVLILDDVISAGTAIRESIEIIKSQGGNPQDVIVAIDRQEKGQGELSATEEIRTLYNLNVHSLICLDDIIEYIKKDDRYSQYLSSIENYRAKYGI
jgi:orotate phosphoribosyltransferase